MPTKVPSDQPSTKPSVTPTASPSTTPSGAPTTFIDLGTDDERCLGWGYTLNNCMYGVYGADGNGDPSKWVSSGQSLPTDARECASTVSDLENVPATGGNACPNAAASVTAPDKTKDGTSVDKTSTASGDSASWKSPGSFMTETSCVEISVENK